MSDRVESKAVRPPPARHGGASPSSAAVDSIGRALPTTAFGQRAGDRQVPLEHRVLGRRERPGSIVDPGPRQDIARVAGGSGVIEPQAALPAMIRTHRAARPNLVSEGSILVGRSTHPGEFAKATQAMST